MRIVFMGTAELACPSLEAIADQVVAVITQPDRPKGRSLHLTPPPVKITAGDIIRQRAEPIRGDDTAGTLHNRLASLGARLLVETLKSDFPRRPQDESQVTYARKLTKEDGRIDWSKPPIEIERQIRAFNPW